MWLSNLMLQDPWHLWQTFPPLRRITEILCNNDSFITTNAWRVWQYRCRVAFHFRYTPYGWSGFLTRLKEITFRTSSPSFGFSLVTLSSPISFRWVWTCFSLFQWVFHHAVAKNIKMMIRIKMAVNCFFFLDGWVPSYCAYGYSHLMTWRMLLLWLRE